MATAEEQGRGSRSPRRRRRRPRRETTTSTEWSGPVTTMYPERDSVLRWAASEARIDGEGWGEGWWRWGEFGEDGRWERWGVPPLRNPERWGMPPLPMHPPLARNEAVSPPSPPLVASLGPDPPSDSRIITLSYPNTSSFAVLSPTRSTSHCRRCRIRRFCGTEGIICLFDPPPSPPPGSSTSSAMAMPVWAMAPVGDPDDDGATSIAMAMAASVASSSSSRAPPPSQQRWPSIGNDQRIGDDRCPYRVRWGPAPMEFLVIRDGHLDGGRIVMGLTASAVASGALSRAGLE